MSQQQGTNTIILCSVFLMIFGCAQSQLIDDTDTTNSRDNIEKDDDEADKDEGDQDDDKDGDLEQEATENDNSDDNSDDNDDDNDDGNDDDNDDVDASEEAPESRCDGENVDCYQECWKCALENDCASQLEECKADVGKGGCADYRDCINDSCCDDGVCLMGDDWLACIQECQEDVEASDNALKLWRQISKCVACDACPISCVEKRPGEFHICIDEEEINSVDSTCYEEDLERYDNDVACYSWAGWGGPCSPWVQKCYNSEDCWAMQKCYDDVWIHNDWSDRIEACENKFDSEIVTDFYRQRQCIYCQACDVSCLKDAGSANCWEYTPLY